MIIKSEKGISDAELKKALIDAVKDKKPSRVLLLPPDATRLYSGAGKICNIYYHYFEKICEVDVMPALGTHEKMSEDECRMFFGDIPYDRFIAHDWRHDVVKLGEVPAEYVSEVSDGLVNTKIDVEVNKRIASGPLTLSSSRQGTLASEKYNLIISMGQVVPHEVVGMANYSKNVFVGCGGSSMINSSHMLGAFYGMERIMGRDFSPVRKVFDYAEEHFLKDVPLLYVLTVTTNTGDRTNIHGLFIGRERRLFEEAVKLSQEKNLIYLDKPIQKCVVYLDPREFKSTWLGNKAIYRTRMAMADGGQLTVIAPGVAKFGEDAENDRLIRKYGYVGRKRILELVKENEDLRNNLSVAAHLIHGSSDGRFNVTYAAGKLTREETEGAAFGYMPIEEALKKYDINTLKDGYNDVCGEEIFYISNPALGLWATRDRIK